jgi:hypothetical protein
MKGARRITDTMNLLIGDSPWFSGTDDVDDETGFEVMVEDMVGLEIEIDEGSMVGGKVLRIAWVAGDR